MIIIYLLFSLFLQSVIPFLYLSQSFIQKAFLGHLLYSQQCGLYRERIKTVLALRGHVLYFWAVPSVFIKCYLCLNSQLRHVTGRLPQGRHRDAGEPCTLTRPLGHCLSPLWAARIKEVTLLSEYVFILFLFGEGLCSFIFLYFYKFTAERPRPNYNTEKWADPRTML